MLLITGEEKRKSRSSSLGPASDDIHFLDVCTCACMGQVGRWADGQMGLHGVGNVEEGMHPPLGHRYGQPNRLANWLHMEHMETYLLIDSCMVYIVDILALAITTAIHHAGTPCLAVWILCALCYLSPWHQSYIHSICYC